MPALAAMLAVLALGCGSDEGGGGSAPGGGAQAEPVARVEVTETEFELDPAEAKVERTGTVAVEVKNAGEIVHALQIEGPAGEFGTARLQPGQSEIIKADLSQAGTYTWYCPVADHRPRGMEGTLTVGDAAAGGGSGGGAEEEDSGGGSGGY